MDQLGQEPWARKKKSKLAKEGLEFETVPEGKKIYAKTLTAERIEQLNSIGFPWAPQGPRGASSWEDNFKALMQYHERTGKWPIHSMGSLGDWVNKQRTKFKRGDKYFMKTHAWKVSLGVWKVGGKTGPSISLVLSNQCIV